MAVKAEDGAEPMKVDEAPVVKPEPGSATPTAAQSSGRRTAPEKAQQLPTTPASQLRSSSSVLASPSPFV